MKSPLSVCIHLSSIAHPLRKFALRATTLSSVYLLAACSSGGGGSAATDPNRFLDSADELTQVDAEVLISGDVEGSDGSSVENSEPSFVDEVAVDEVSPSLVDAVEAGEGVTLPGETDEAGSVGEISVVPVSTNVVMGGGVVSSPSSEGLSGSTDGSSASSGGLAEPLPNKDGEQDATIDEAASVEESIEEESIEEEIEEEIEEVESGSRYFRPVSVLSFIQDPESGGAIEAGRRIRFNYQDDGFLAQITHEEREVLNGAEEYQPVWEILYTRVTDEGDASSFTVILDERKLYPNENPQANADQPFELERAVRVNRWVDNLFVETENTIYNYVPVDGRIFFPEVSWQPLFSDLDFVEYNADNQIIQKYKRDSGGDTLTSTYFYSDEGRLIKREAVEPSASGSVTLDYLYQYRAAAPSISQIQQFSQEDSAEADPLKAAVTVDYGVFDQDTLTLSIETLVPVDTESGTVLLQVGNAVYQYEQSPVDCTVHERTITVIGTDTFGSILCIEIAQ